MVKFSITVRTASTYAITSGRGSEPPDGAREWQDLCPGQVGVTLPLADLRWGLAEWSGDVRQVDPAARMGSRGQKQVVRQLLVAVASGFGLEFDYQARSRHSTAQSGQPF